MKQFITHSIMCLLVSVSMIAHVGANETAAVRLRLPHVFSDHMVLQRDKPVRIWGFAKPGQVVTVGFAGQKGSVLQR